jgi:hypothetical protein
MEETRRGLVPYTDLAQEEALQQAQDRAAAAE